MHFTRSLCMVILAIYFVDSVPMQEKRVEFDDDFEEGFDDSVEKREEFDDDFEDGFENDSVEKREEFDDDFEDGFDDDGVEKGEEFDDFEEFDNDGVEKRTDGKLETLKVCFACDSNCVKDLPKDENEKQEFFKTMMSVAGQAFEVSGIQLEPDHLFSKKKYPLKKYSGEKSGDSALTQANINFWEKRFPAWMKKYDCGVGFLLTSDRDPSWRHITKDAVARMSSACQKTGTGVLKLTSSGHTMGTMLAHELGHELGVYHDCGFSEKEIEKFNYLKTRAKSDKAIAAIDNVLEKCSEVSSDCLEHNFLMKAAPTGDFPYPTEFSECSKALINFFLEAKDDSLLVQIYNSKCIAKKD